MSKKYIFVFYSCAITSWGRGRGWKKLLGNDAEIQTRLDMQLPGLVRCTIYYPGRYASRYA